MHSKIRVTLTLLFGVLLWLPAQGQDAAKKSMLAFDLYHMKSALSEALKADINRYFKEAISSQVCFIVPTDEERERIASESGTMVFDWAANQRMAQQTTQYMKVDGYITGSIMDDRSEAGKTRVSIVYHPNGTQMRYEYLLVEGKEKDIKVAFDALIAGLCN